MKRFLYTLLSLLLVLSMLVGCGTIKPPVSSASTAQPSEGTNDPTQAVTQNPTDAPTQTPTDAPNPPITRTVAVWNDPATTNPNWKDTANLPMTPPEQKLEAELIREHSAHGGPEFFVASLITTPEELDAYFAREKISFREEMIQEVYDSFKDHDFSQTAILFIGWDSTNYRKYNFVELLKFERSLIIHVESDYDRTLETCYPNTSGHFAIAIRQSDLAALGELEEIYLYTTYFYAADIDKSSTFYSPEYEGCIYPLSRYVYKQVTQ